MRAFAVVFALFAAVLVATTPVTAATLEWEQWVRIDPTDDMEYTDTFNASASNASDYTNYNATIAPFMNETNITGTFTGGYLPPVVYQVSDATAWSMYFGSVVRFKSEWVMSGSSVSWWRVPALNLTGWSTMYLQIWRIDNPGWLNVSWAAAGPDEAARPYCAFTRYYTGSGWNYTLKGQTVEAWGQNFTFVYMRVDAPIHADTFYYVQWFVQGGNTTGLGERLLFSQNDIGDDGRYWTNLYGANMTEVEADLDIAVIHQYGMGHTVSGFPIIYDEGGGGGGDATMPSNEDDMTDALSPSGTGDGGQWDGDWSNGNKVSVATDGSTVHEGTYSIKVTTTATGQAYPQYKLDTAYDLSSQEYVNCWVYPVDSEMLSVRFYLRNQAYPGSGGGVHYTLQGVDDLTEDAWNLIQLPCNDWVADGWTEFGSFDETDFDYWMIVFLDNNQIGNEAYVDHFFFNVSGGGGGGSDPSIEFYSNITDGPSSGSDYVTFMMPLMFDVGPDAAAKVRIRNTLSGFDWTFYVDTVQDFILNSTVWPYPGVEGNSFHINVTFQNQSNVIFIHDYNAAGHPGFDDTLATHKNRFQVYDSNGTLQGQRIHFRPYHALQVTNGTWENTHIDPTYIWDGRVVNITDMKMREQPHSDPIWYRVLVGARTLLFAAYMVTDKVLMNDLLPDLDVILQQFTYDTNSNRGLRVGGGAILFAVITFLEDAYEWILEYGPAILTFIVKVIALVIMIPVFAISVLVVNSVKRYFAIFAADGPEVAGQYSAHLVRNAFKRFPLPDIDRTTEIEKVEIGKMRRAQARAAKARAKAAAAARAEAEWRAREEGHARQYGTASPYHPGFSSTWSKKGQRQHLGMTYEQWRKYKRRQTRWKHRGFE